METIFLSLSEVLEIHQDQITRYGGASGIRDIDLLKSAIGVPSTTFNGDFLHTDIFEMAATYLFHIVKNHPFIDGNKRTGTVAALIFLILNGFDFHASEKALADTVIQVAHGTIDKSDLTIFFRTWTKQK